jgi:phosphoribosylformylglycinamidine synthase
MKNDFYDGSTKISIPPTLLFSVIGTIPDIRNAVTMDFKRPGDIICLLGATKDELGGSEYLAMQGYTGNKVPKVDLASALARYKALHQAIMGGLVASCHDLSDGGLAVAVTESAFSGGFGCRIELANIRFEGDQRYRNDEVLLFSESASRLLVTVHPAQWTAFEEAMAGTTFSQIGQVADKDMVKIAGLAGKTVLQGRLEQLKAAWQRTLRDL